MCSNKNSAILVTGCRECTYAASKTFVMDDSEGTARVCKQWADPEPLIKVSILLMLSSSCHGHGKFIYNRIP